MRNPFRKDIEPRCAYCAHGSAVNVPPLTAGYPFCTFIISYLL